MQNQYRFPDRLAIIVLGLMLAATPLDLAAQSQDIAPAHPHVQVGTRIEVAPEVASSAAEQLALARQRIAALRRIADPQQRLKAVLEVMSILSVVPRKWPTAGDLILESYVLHAELAMQHSMPTNAISVLHEALPKSDKTTFHVTVQRSLARAYDRMGDTKAAETHYVAAEQSPMLRKMDRREAGGVLQEIGSFYSRQGRPRDAIKRWRAAAQLPGQPADAKAHLLLSSLKDAVQLRDDPDQSEAKRIAEEVARIIKDARKEAKRDPRTLDAYEADLNRIRKQFGV